MVINCAHIASARQALVGESRAELFSIHYRVSKCVSENGIRQGDPEAGLPPTKLRTLPIGAPHSGIVPANTDEPFDF